MTVQGRPPVDSRAERARSGQGGQRPAPGGQQPAVIPQANAPDQNERPLGDLDLAAFGNDDAAHKTFIEGLTEQQRNELKDRCTAIPLNAAQPADQNVMDFCKALGAFFQEGLQR
jgi:hypothetical protein